jgi:hypothetical protein
LPTRSKQTAPYIVLFCVVQFAGGFDAESMAAFEALRNRAHLGNNPKT